MRTSRRSRRAGAKVENGFLFSKARSLRRLLHGPLRDARAPNQHSGLARADQGHPGCSRCERSLDTASACVASSRVVPLISAPPPPWPHLWASDDSDANTASSCRGRNAPRSAPLPPATNAPAGCLASRSRPASVTWWFESKCRARPLVPIARNSSNARKTQITFDGLLTIRSGHACETKQSKAGGAYVR